MSGGAADAAEQDPDDRALGERLAATRPVPQAGFRGTLGRYLAAHDPGYGPRPPRLRLLALAYLLAGLALIGVGALSAAGLL